MTTLAPQSDESINRRSDADLLDRPRWKQRKSFLSYGVRVGIRVDNLEILKYLPDYLPPMRQELSSPEVDELYSFSTPNACCQDYRLYRNRQKIAQTDRLDEILEILDIDLRIRIGLLAPDCLFVHAGVVAWKGWAIVIPGRSYSGKTTLVTALVKAGATYYSDEYAVFDREGLVHPYSRPLSIRQGRDERVKCSVEKLGGESGVEPLPVGLVVHTKYRVDCSWDSREISPGQGVLALLDNTIVARTRSEFALAVLARSISRAIAIEGERGEAEEGADRIFQQISKILTM